MPLANIYVGERFGKWPWEANCEPADEVAYYQKVMEMEAEESALIEGLPPGDDVIEIE
jgi:hypothetical protein